MRLRLDHRGLTMLLYSRALSQMALQLQTDGSYSNGDTTVTFDQDDILRISSKRLKLTNVRYDKTKPYPVIPPNSGSFGSFAGQFNTPNQPPVYQKNFSGYDLTQVNPMNFQQSAGQKSKNVFVAPDPLGFAYYPDQGKNVPQGLLLVPDAMKSSQTQTTADRTATEHVATQSSSLGFNIGVPKVGSFGVNSEVSTEVKNATDKQSQIVYHEEAQTNYALVADMAKVQLDPDFRAQILRLLRIQSLAGHIPTQADWESNIISIYGTHYANAVTSGLVARSLLLYSKQASTELQSKNELIEVSAEAIFAPDPTGKGKDGKAGIKGAKGSGLSSSVEQDLTTQIEQMQQIGLPDQLAPVLMDLRPLSELLSQIFWDDPAVWSGLRNGLDVAIKTYVAKNAPDYSGPQYIWQPYGFAAKLLSVDFSPVKTKPPYRFGATALPIEGFSGQFGFDLIYKARTPVVVKTIAPADYITLTLDGNPEQKNLHYDLPGDLRTQYFMASEVCDGTNILNALAPSYQINRTTGFITTDFGTKLPGATTNGDPTMVFIYPRNLTKAPQTFQWPGSIKGSGIPFVFKASAWRLADPFGDFMAFPTCPAKGNK